MINTIGEYIKYCWIAKKRHGVHSPFVYDFVDICLRIPIQKDVLKTFGLLKKGFQQNMKTIEVTDFGAGSKKMTNIRDVRKIAKISGTNLKQAKFLYRLSRHYQPNTILELGTSLGLGTFMLAMGNEKAKIETVEGCPNTIKIAKENMPSIVGNRIEFINDSFVNYLSDIPENKIYDLVFIDGDHRSISLLEQIRLLSSHIHDETLIVLDDIRWTQDMKNGWNQLIRNSNFHLTMDLFDLGIISKRHHQQKQHFVIKF